MIKLCRDSLDLVINSEINPIKSSESRYNNDHKKSLGILGSQSLPQKSVASKKRVLTVWSFHKRGLWFDFFCWRRGHFSRCEKGSCFWSGWCGGRFDWRSIFCMICPWRIRNWTARVLRLLTTAIFCQTGTGYCSRISCCISGWLIGIWMAGYYCGGLSCCSSLSNWRGRICRFIMDRFERGSNWNKKKKYLTTINYQS